MTIQFPSPPVVPNIPNLCKEKYGQEYPLYLVEKDIASFQLELQLSNIEYLREVYAAEEEYYNDLQSISRNILGLRDESNSQFRGLEAKKQALKDARSELRSLEQSLEDSRRTQDQLVALIELKEGYLSTLLSEAGKFNRAIDFYTDLVGSQVNQEDMDQLNSLSDSLASDRLNIISRAINLISEIDSLITGVSQLPNIQDQLQEVNQVNQVILDLEFEIGVDTANYRDVQELFSLALDIDNTVLDQRIKLETLDLDIQQQIEEFKIAKLEASLSTANKKYQLNSDAFNCAYSKAISLGQEYKSQRQRVKDLQRELFIAISQSLANTYYTESVVTTTFEGIEFSDDDNFINQKLTSLLPIRESKTGPTNDIAQQLIFDGAKYGFEKTNITKYVIIRTNPVTTAKITISVNRYAYSSLTRVESEIFLGFPPQPNLISLEPQKLKVASPFRTVQFDSRSPEDIQEELDSYTERLEALQLELENLQEDQDFEATQNQLALENTIRNLSIRQENLRQDFNRRVLLLAGENTAIPQGSLILENLENEIEERKAQLRAISNRIRYAVERDICAPIASVSSGKNQPLTTTYQLAFTEQDLRDCYGTDMTKRSLNSVTISFTIPYNPGVKVGSRLRLPSSSPVSGKGFVLEVAHAFQVVRENVIIGQTQVVCGLYRIIGVDIEFPDTFETVLSAVLATRGNYFNRSTV